MLKEKEFGEADHFFNLLLSIDKNMAEVYWGVCLMKIGATCDDDVPNQEKLIKECPEFNKYLALVDEQRRVKVIDLSIDKSRLKK